MFLSLFLHAVLSALRYWHTGPPGGVSESNAGGLGDLPAGRRVWRQGQTANQQLLQLRQLRRQVQVETRPLGEGEW